MPPVESDLYRLFSSVTGIVLGHLGEAAVVQVLRILEIDDARIEGLQDAPKGESGMLDVGSRLGREGRADCGVVTVNGSGRGGHIWATYAPETVAGAEALELVVGQHTLANAIDLESKLADQRLAVDLRVVASINGSLELTKDGVEAGMLFGVGLGKVPQVLLNHELPEKASRLRRPVIVGLGRPVSATVGRGGEGQSRRRERCRPTVTHCTPRTKLGAPVWLGMAGLTASTHCACDGSGGNGRCSSGGPKQDEDKGPLSRGVSGVQGRPMPDGRGEIE
ncbi:MAG: hypothetical protein M1823_006120 [Watsoniomyces obsoletus]|nr:MAG: hypothetical protein M1823_006120 [Watsoniomyces obsoletus]